MTTSLAPAAETSWELVAHAQAGDADAFGEIYRRYADGLFTYAYRRVRTREQAQDIVSDTFLRALKSLHRWEPGGTDFGAVLTTIARNLIADYYKSGRYRLELSTGDVLSEDRPDEAVEGRPEDSVVERLAMFPVADLFKHLSDEQRQVINLRFYNDCSVAETAQAMGKNEGAVKALQYRAIQTLARHIPGGLR